MVDPKCKCGLQPETTLDYLLRLISTPPTHWNWSNVCILNPSLNSYPNEKSFYLKILSFFEGSENFKCNMIKYPVLMVFTFHVYISVFYFRDMWRTSLQSYVTFSMFCALFSLVLDFFILCILFYFIYFILICNLHFCHL